MACIRVPLRADSYKLHVFLGRESLHANVSRDADAVPPVSTRNRHILALSTLAFTGGLGGGVVFPILPLLGMQLGIPAVLIGLILSLNRITRLAVNPLAGIVVDHIGARGPLIVGMLVEAFSTLCFYVGVHSRHPAAWFLGGRALWGVGSSLLMVGVMTAALVFSDIAERGLATAKVRMSMSIGMPAGLVLGGVVAANFSPGAAFLTAAAITFLGALIAWYYAPAATRPGPAAVSNPRTPAITLLLLLRSGPLWNVWLFNFFMFFAVQGVILSVLVLLVHDRHLALHGWGTEGTAGGLMALMIGSSALVSWWVGKRIDRTQRKTPAVIAGIVALMGGFVLLALSGQAVHAAIALLLIGIGVGAINVPMILFIGELVPAASYGRAIGIYQVLGDLGGSFGPIIGLEAVQRFGGTSALLGVTGLLTAMLPLAALLWRRERGRGGL